MDNKYKDFCALAKEIKEMETALKLFELKRKNAENEYEELKRFLFIEDNVSCLPFDLQQASCNDFEKVEQRYYELLEYQAQSVFSYFLRLR